MKTEVIRVGVMGVNCGIVYDEETGKGLVIDPGAQADKILALLEDRGVSVEAVLLTHGHFDHIMAADAVREKYQAPVIIGGPDAELLQDPEKNLARPYMHREVTLNADRTVSDGDELPYQSGIRVLMVPGHTPGSVCYYFEKEKLLFSGDALFAGSIGRTDSYEEQDLLIRGIREKLLVLPDDTRVIPGHEGLTGIGREKRYNPFLE